MMEAKAFIVREVEELIQTLSMDDELYQETIRFHLVVEASLTRVIKAALPNGKRYLKKVRPLFLQKLYLVDGLGFLDNPTLQALRGLNDIRNNCAHDPRRVVSRGDIDGLGSAFGSDYARFVQENGASLKTLALQLFAHVFGKVAYSVFEAEHGVARGRDGNGP